MDSTTSDPQPHQLQAPPPTPVTTTSSSSSQSSQQIATQQQHHQQHQHQLQHQHHHHHHHHHQQPQQQQPKPHQNQQPHHQHPTHHPHPHQHLIHSSPPTQQANYQYQQPCISSYHHVRGPYGAPTFSPTFTHAAQFAQYMPAVNFPVAQAQTLTSTVGPHMQSNVPPLHTKTSTQVINSVLCTDNRPHNQTSQSATLHNQVATSKDPQERKKAILKHPETLEEIPWENSSSKSSSSSTTKETSNTLAPSNNPSGEHVHAFLQKVSETTNSGRTNNSNKQQKRPQQRQQNQNQNEKPTIVSNVAEDNKKITNSEAFPSINATLASEHQATTTATTTTTTTTNASTTTTSPAKSTIATIIQAPSNATNITSDKTTTTTNTTHATATATTTTTTITPTTPSVPPSFPATSSLKSAVIVSDRDDDNSSNKENENGNEKVNGDEVNRLGKSEQEVEGKVKESETEAAKPEATEAAAASNDSKTEDKKQEDSEKVELKYEPWQYNPLSNREGKRIYSRQFLLDVKESIRDTLEPEREELESYHNRNNHVDFFCPTFSTGGQRYNQANRQNEPARRQSQHNYAGRSSAGQEKQRKVITSVSLTQEVELKTTSNPWRPTKEIKEDVPNNVTETESLKKKFRSILNKLTPDNFENLKKAVTELDINTESNLGEVIDIVFAKALAEPGYCVLYGQMCSHLKKNTAGSANFGTILLQRCQQQFQSDIYSGLNLKERKEKIEIEENPDVKKQLNEELYEDMYRCRMRGLGLIKFIGELYKIEMLNDQIMFDCVIRLLSDTSEESLECLCDLLTTIGEKLDRSTSQRVAEKEKKAPRSALKANAYQGGQKSAAAVVASGSTSSQQQKGAQQQQAPVTTLDQVFEQLHKIRKYKDLPLSVRIRFKLLDTCELREKYNWQSKKTKDNNPKKTKEIREAHQEKLEKERQQNAMGPRRSQEGRRGLGHSGGSSSQLSSLANESSGNRGSMHTSSSSHLLRDPSSMGDIDAIKEHQRKLHVFKGITNLANATNRPSSDDPTSLRPQSTILLRPQSHLSPVGKSAATQSSATDSASK